MEEVEKGNGEMVGVCWRGNRRVMMRGNFWIGVWMRENGR